MEKVLIALAKIIADKKVRDKVLLIIGRIKRSETRCC